MTWGTPFLAPSLTVNEEAMQDTTLFPARQTAEKSSPGRSRQSPHHCPLHLRGAMQDQATLHSSKDTCLGAICSSLWRGLPKKHSDEKPWMCSPWVVRTEPSREGDGEDGRGWERVGGNPSPKPTVSRCCSNLDPGPSEHLRLQGWWFRVTKSVIHKILKMTLILGWFFTRRDLTQKMLAVL